MTVFDEIHKGLPAKEFPKSSKTIEKSYCTVTGKLAGSNCTSTKKGWYKITALPSVCTTCTGVPTTDTTASNGSIGDTVNDVVDNLGNVLNDIIDNR